ncbi:hypothetical protein TRFO_20820 [Tritrichomonas foetus]|uniref:Leucine Rich Repeat family protein n=1 Tax=Tritrichomonas foetus TaxID=1144522 RepID=A0A1J4KFT1_9EUKA|nr:hypothetical protein TRFO_20820 [Tritrichomonas foetus]|eukprot:OHT10083.1 hypothetical protein TRFO_20820 [Tritrichomonas foetus]
MKLSKKIRQSEPSFSVRVTAQGIEEIDHCPARYLNCSQLFLSHNSISSLKKITQFHYVSRLMLEYNNIKNIEDLEPLGKLPNLVELRLEGNPVCRLFLWDLYTIDTCKVLRLLNGKEVRRNDLKKFLKFETDLMDTIYQAEISRLIFASTKYKKLTNEQKLSAIKEQYKKLPRNEFSSTLRVMKKTPNSKPLYKDRNSYLKFLKNKCAQVHSAVDSSIPAVSEIFQQHHDYLQKLKNFPENSTFLNLSNILAGLGLQAIGMNVDNELTNELTNLANHEENEISPLISKGLEMSKFDPSEIQSPSKIISREENFNDSYLPELSIEMTSDLLQTGKIYSPTLSTIKNCDFEVKLENSTDNRENPPKKTKEMKSQIQNNEEANDKINNDNANNDEQRVDDEFQKFDNLSSTSYFTNDGKTNPDYLSSEIQKSLESNDNSNAKNEVQSSNSDSDSSFEIINAASPSFAQTAPLSNLNLENLSNYSPKFLASPVSSARRRASRSALEDIKINRRQCVMSKIAGSPDSFLGLKFFELWKKRFKRRVHRRIRRNELGHKSADLSYLADFVMNANLDTDTNSSSAPKEPKYKTIIGEPLLSSEGPSPLIRSKSLKVKTGTPAIATLKIIA